MLVPGSRVEAKLSQALAETKAMTHAKETAEVRQKTKDDDGIPKVICPSTLDISIFKEILIILNCVGN